MKLIRATNFYEYVRCPKKVELYFFGDPKEKIPYSEFMEKKFQEGRDFETEIASELEFAKPSEQLSHEEAAKETLKFMKEKENLIYQGVLIHENLIGIPDFLEKVRGKSDLGNHFYQVVDVKSGLSAKREYIMQIIFYSFLLEKIQGFLPPKAYLVLGDKTRVEVDVKENLEKFKEIFQRIKEIAAGAKEHVHICGVCKECQWREFCLDLAKKNNDLSLIYNISWDHVDILKQHKIKNLKDAAKMDITQLSDIKGVTDHTLNRWKLQAQSLTTHKTIRISDYNFPKTTSIFFDVEDTEEDGEKIVYLFGLIENKKYTGIIAKKPSEQKKAWEKFLDFFKDKKDFSIYVYSGHEKSMLKKLYQKYGGDETIYNLILNNMLDLLSVVKHTFIFPIYSYSIKDVAKFLGFRWTAEDAGGAQSMIWYQKWLEKKDKKYLNEVLRYNEEDCKAMEIVKNFIENDKKKL